MNPPDQIHNSRRVFWLTPDRFDQKQDKSTWLEMTKWLNKLGWNASILASQASSQENVSKYDEWVTYMPSIDLPFIFRISTLINLYKWLKYNANYTDIIIVNEDALWLAPILRRLKFVNIHLDIRTLPVSVKGFKARLNRLLFWYVPLRFFTKHASSRSFITERLKAEVEAEFCLPQGVPECVWQSGVNTSIFHPNNDSSLPHSELRLFYHGSISLERGLDLVIKGLSLLDQREEIVFTIVGDGPDLEQLKILAIELEIADRVHFRGFVPYEDVASNIFEADVCICPLPDRLEWNVSSPLKVLEYAACGKPVILTPIPAHLDVFSGEDFVTWTAGFKPSHFEQAILEARNKLNSVRSTGHNRASHVASQYDWSSQASKLDTTLREVYLDHHAPPNADGVPTR